MSPLPSPPTVALVDVREAALSLDEVWRAVADPAAGGVVLFVGTVRDNDERRAVAGLGYTAHPQAMFRLAEVVNAVAADFPIVRLAAVHRVGDLSIGDLAVVVGASAAHRGDAFAAARRCIDDLKAQVPIWKHQVFTDGSEEWVGTP